MNEDAATHDLDAEGRDFFLEGRWRRAGFRLILVAMPWASDAAVDDTAFSQGAILVLADVGNRGDLAVIAKHCNSFPGERNDGRTFFRDAVYFANFDKAVPGRLLSGLVNPPLTPRRHQMKRNDCARTHD